MIEAGSDRRTHTAAVLLTCTGACIGIRSFRSVGCGGRQVWTAAPLFAFLLISVYHNEGEHYEQLLIYLAIIILILSGEAPFTARATCL